MNKQSFYLLGGALLASTALSTVGNAAIIVSTAGAGAKPVTTAFVPKALATEVFSATATVANALVIGNNTTSTLNGQYLIDFAAQLSSGFNIQLNLTGAAFTGTVGTTVYVQSTSGTLNITQNATLAGSCLVQTLPDKILVTGCTPQGTSQLSRADAIAITGAQFISAGALSTAGNSIKLDGLVTNSAGSITFENITQATIITSKSEAETAIENASNLTVDNNATPAFTKFVSPASATATLGTIHFSSTSAVGTDLSNTLTAATSMISTSELKITHSLLNDPALVSIAIGVTGVASKSLSQFVSGTVSFQVPAISISNSVISVTFDGTTGILASSGTASATVTPTAASNPARAVAAFTGNIATLSRGGLSVENNSLFPTAGQGSTLYQSLLRIANQSAVDGVATLTVKRDDTGATIGSYTVAVTAGGTKQVSSRDIETNVTTAAATGAAYKVVVSGSFNGYVQNLVWNSVTGVFSDVSGFRNGTLTQDP